MSARSAKLVKGGQIVSYMQKRSEVAQGKQKGDCASRYPELHQALRAASVRTDRGKHERQQPNVSRGLREKAVSKIDRKGWRKAAPKDVGEKERERLIRR